MSDLTPRELVAQLLRDSDVDFLSTTPEGLADDILSALAPVQPSTEAARTEATRRHEDDHGTVITPDDFVAGAVWQRVQPDPLRAGVRAFLGQYASADSLRCGVCSSHSPWWDGHSGCETAAIERLRALLAETEVQPTPLRDEHHTMDELYEYRMLYNAHAFNAWHRLGCYPVVKSRFHSDGTRPFGKENLFVVVAVLPEGQVANHYDVEFWDLFAVPEVDLPPQYDGHNPEIAAQRLHDALLRTEN